MHDPVASHRHELERDGFTCLQGFYGEAELTPLKASIVSVIGKLYVHHLKKPFPSGLFDSAAIQSAYMELVRHDRKLGGLVYDAVKQLPEFIRITASEKNLGLACSLRGSSLMGITRGGDGIRIDHPFEEKFMAPWHQDYPSQFGSPDGLVFWAPLVTVTQEIGPLEICLGSHRGGTRPIYYDDENNANPYTMHLVNEEEIISAYPHKKLLCAVGDLLVIDFLALHRSGFNHSAFARWSMQLRYFNFENEEGLTRGWPSGFSQGSRLEMLHPELVVKKP